MEKEPMDEKIRSQVVYMPVCKGDHWDVTIIPLKMVVSGGTYEAALRRASDMLDFYIWCYDNRPSLGGLTALDERLQRQWDKGRSNDREEPTRRSNDDPTG